MDNKSPIQGYELIWVIVNSDHGSKVLKIAKQNGIKGGTVFFGMGTSKNRLLDFLGIADIKKEIVLMAAEESSVNTIIGALVTELELKKPHHGIAFTLPLTAFLKAGSSEYAYNKSGGNNMYHLIVTIVEKDRAEMVMEAANEVGAGGGTVIKGRGASTQESKLFFMDIEPEKEIVLILSEIANTEKIVNSIRDKLDIDKPGKGVIFCHEVSKVYGLFEKQKK